MAYAVMGKILWVDLTSREIWEEIIPDEVYRRFMSGVGLAAYILYREIPPGADPLGAKNVMGFTSGLLTGTSSLFTGRWMVTAKSPLTGTWGEANCGGNLAPAIKRCGYDGIFFKGASADPVYLLVQDGKAELRDAASLWGQDTVETEAQLRAMHPGVSAACIGPAGEKRSLIAGICNDGGRLAARSGLGAVMGAKNLKAVALRGNHKITVFDRAEMQKLSKRAYAWTHINIPLPPGKITRFVGTLFRAMPAAMAQDGLLYKLMLRQWGTISMNQVSVEMGDAPIQNWQGSSATFGLGRSGSADPDLITRYETRKYHCRSCALGCGGIISTAAIPEGHKPEYETVLSWGGLLMNEDLESIFAINERLNRAGMDSISAGNTAAFAIECAEKGWITAEMLDGLELGWGRSAAIRELLERMIAREGIGDLLADGTRKAAQRLAALQSATQTTQNDGFTKCEGLTNREGIPANEDHPAFEAAVQAGGQELAMHDGRNDPGFALHAAVEPMPGRHTNGSQLYYEMFQLWTRVPGLPKVKPFYPKGHKYRATHDQAVAAVACSRFSQVMNGAGLCLFGAFVGVSRIPVFEWINAAAGWQHSPQEIMTIGARIQALKQLFNHRQGVPLRHTINRRAIGLPPQAHGANRGRTLDMDAMVKAYWQASGWDEESGQPAPETLHELGLDPALPEE